MHPVLRILHNLQQAQLPRPSSWSTQRRLAKCTESIFLYQRKDRPIAIATLIVGSSVKEIRLRMQGRDRDGIARYVESSRIREGDSCTAAGRLILLILIEAEGCGVVECEIGGGWDEEKG